MGRTVGIFTGVFDVNRNTGEIFQHDFAGKARMTAGAARRDDEPLAPAEGFDDWLKCLCCRSAAWDVVLDGLCERLRLLVDLAQHGVREGCGLRGLWAIFDSVMRFSSFVASSDWTFRDVEDRPHLEGATLRIPVAESGWGSKHTVSQMVAASDWNSFSFPDRMYDYTDLYSNDERERAAMISTIAARRLMSAAGVWSIHWSA